MDGTVRVWDVPAIEEFLDREASALRDLAALSSGFVLEGFDLVRVR